MFDSLKKLWNRKANLAERSEEMRMHLEMEIEAGLRKGLSPEEARRRARLRAGLLSEGLESANEELGFRWLDGALADLRHGSRALLRNRGFAAVAILVLASSVAINTLIFCMLDGVVLKPLPYKDPAQLVRLYDRGETVPKFPMSIGHYLDYRANSKSIQSIALYTMRDMELSGVAGSESQQLSGMQITPDYFEVLGLPLARGASFTDADLRETVRNVIISHRLWRTQFHSDGGVIGSTIRLDRELWTIVGVAPEGFQHVGGEYRSPLQGETVDVWTPLPVSTDEGAMRASHYCNAIARLKSSYTTEQARQELASIAASYQERFGNYGKWSITVAPLLAEVGGRSIEVVWLLVAAGGLVMLVACANVAGLSMARAVSRRGELALRHALGASRWQLLRVGMAENLLLGAVGAAVGLLLTRAGMPLLHQLLPADFPRAQEIALTWSSGFFAVAVAIAVVGIAGLLPSPGTLESQRVTANRDSRKMRTLLVAGEVALAGLLCAGALFLLRSYREVGARDHGFDASNVLTFRLTAQAGTQPPKGVVARLYDNIAAKIRDIPGVVSAGATTNLPWSGYDENSNFQLPGKEADSARFQGVSPGYFEAAGMQLQDGRFFDWMRDANQQPKTIIINDVLANRDFPNGHAVGAKARVFGEYREIVGVVKGLRDFPADLDVKAAYWFPLTQAEFKDVFFAVRTRPGVDPASITPAVTAAVHAVDPQLPLAEIRTLERSAAAAMAARRFALWLFQAFAALALVLASAGIYGLLAYIVQQRRKELSVRVALGASRANLWRMVLSDGLRMAAGGALCCLVLIPVGGYLLRAFLFQVQAFDLFTIAGAPTALLIAATAASLGPAWSAMRSDPAQALREE